MTCYSYTANDNTKCKTNAMQLNLLPNAKQSYPNRSKMHVISVLIFSIPDVNGRPKHDNPFGKAMEKDVMLPLAT